MDLLIAYALTFVGKPYIWGDKSPVLGGFDCSGFVCEILKFAGELGPRESLNSQGLLDRFSPISQHGLLSPGSLAFYGKDVTKIEHVAFMVSPYQILEAAGGDSSTIDAATADARNAMVRGRLLNYRSDFIQTLKPQYLKIGAFKR